MKKELSQEVYTKCIESLSFVKFGAVKTLLFIRIETVIGHKSNRQLGAKLFPYRFPKKHLAGQRYGPDADVKQAVTSWPHI